MSLDEQAGISLLSIDEAYGTSADLYKDVLGVKSNATPEQIQKAYFARRNELFTILQHMETDEQDSVTASHHFHAERKMRAVQTTMRILGDPALRLEYDDIRHERLGAEGSLRKDLQQPPSVLVPKVLTRHRNHGGSSTEPVNKLMVSTSTAVSTKKPRHVTPEHKVYTRAANAYPSETEEDDDDDDDTRQECTTIGDDLTYEEEQTILSETSYRSEGTMTVLQQPPEPRHDTCNLIGRVKDEVFGAMEDTATSFAQVLNAFTLQEEDITAVTKRIDKAARQMKTTL